VCVIICNNNDNNAWKLEIRVVSSKPLKEGGIVSFTRRDINKQISPIHVKK
jgi:hypothetical protein